MNSKKELWVLLASFVLPIALGTAFFYWNPSAFTNSTVNYGEFINPIITTEKQDLVFAHNAQSDLQGLWTFAYVTSNCDNACVQTLRDIKTTRILMNEDMRRIQRLLLTTGVVQASVQDSDLLIASPSHVLKQQLRRFPDNSLFLIDPLGNIMMYYDPKTLNIKRVIKDLKRLFKYSRVG